MGALTGEFGAEWASIKYYRDVDGFNRVTARPLSDLVWKAAEGEEGSQWRFAQRQSTQERIPDLAAERWTLPYRQALATETQAQADYNRVLRVFRHIVLNGSVPDEI